MHVEICRRVLIKSTQHLHCDTHGYKNYFFFITIIFFLQKHLCTFFVIWVIGNQNEIKKKLQRKTVFIFTLHYIFLQLSMELAWSKAGMGKLRPGGHMRPVKRSDSACQT